MPTLHIFAIGGTGFPLLLKTLRQSKTMPNAAAIAGAQIGAVSVLPYFNLTQNAASEIDSSTFFAKTRAALAYYQQGGAGANALYYLGHLPQNQYANHEGGSTQR